MTKPSWRGFLRTWRDRDRQEDRTRNLEALSAAGALSLSSPGRDRLGGFRGPIRWLSYPPAQQTAEGGIVARIRRQSWGRDGAWMRYPMCRIGWGHWATEEWVPSMGWVRLPGRTLVWPRKVHAVLPGMHPTWRRCGTEDLVPPIVAVRHLRAALVHWRPLEAELSAASITSADLVPLLECPEHGVRDGAIQAFSWVRYD